MPANHLEISEKELDEMNARADAARNAPWVSYVEGRDHYAGSDFIMIGEGESLADIELSGATVEDQDFIAAARQDVPRLVAEVRRLRKAIDALTGGT